MLQNRTRSTKGWIQKSKSLVFGCLTIALTLAPVYADRVISCHDGDTCKVQADDGKKFKVRLSSIDAPEADQPFGGKARDRLKQLVVDRPVTIKCSGISYDRKTCDIYAPEDVSAILVREGLAWDYTEFSHGKYKTLEEEAKKKKLGLWGESRITSPYCWRWMGKEECKNPQYQP